MHILLIKQKQLSVHEFYQNIKSCLKRFHLSKCRTHHSNKTINKTKTIIGSWVLSEHEQLFEKVSLIKVQNTQHQFYENHLTTKQY